MYQTRDEAQLRLSNTVVIYDKAPIWVRQALHNDEGLIVLEVCRLKGNRTKVIELRDPKLNLRNLPLGYMNCTSNVRYLTRIPTRRYKQGLCRSNVHIPNLDAEVMGGVINQQFYQEEEQPAPGADLQHIMGEEGFTHMMTGVYPAYANVMELLTDKKRPIQSMAFSRTLALAKDNIELIYIGYKGERVGWSEDGEQFKLAKQFHYLNEIMEQNGVRIR